MRWGFLLRTGKIETRTLACKENGILGVNMTGIGLQVTMTATAEVRDAEGNLLNTFPVEHTRPLTEEEMAEILGPDTLES